MQIRIEPFQIIFMNLYARDGSLTNLEKQEEEGREDMALYMFSRWIGVVSLIALMDLRHTYSNTWCHARVDLKPPEGNHAKIVA